MIDRAWRTAGEDLLISVLAQRPDNEIPAQLCNILILFDELLCRSLHVFLCHPRLHAVVLELLEDVILR